MPLCPQKPEKDSLFDKLYAAYQGSIEHLDYKLEVKVENRLECGLIPDHEDDEVYEIANRAHDQAAVTACQKVVVNEVSLMN